MSFSAVGETLPAVCWLLFLVNIIWSVIYDTQYAMVDRDDDLKIGVKSTAILFGQYDKLIIGLLQLLMVGLLLVIGSLAGLGTLYYISLVLVAGLFIYQQQLMVNRERAPCFKAL